MAGRKRARKTQPVQEAPHLPFLHYPAPAGTSKRTLQTANALLAHALTTFFADGWRSRGIHRLCASRSNRFALRACLVNSGIIRRGGDEDIMVREHRGMTRMTKAKRRTGGGRE